MLLCERREIDGMIVGDQTSYISFCTYVLLAHASCKIRIFRNGSNTFQNHPTSLLSSASMNGRWEADHEPT